MPPRYGRVKAEAGIMPESYKREWNRVFGKTPLMGTNVDPWELFYF